MKSFNFNKIIILQSINPYDPAQSCLREPGPYLNDEIYKKLTKPKSSTTDVYYLSRKHPTAF